MVREQHMRHPLRKYFDLSIYFVADPSICNGRALPDIVKQAASGGVTMVQLRDKSDAFKDAIKIRNILKPLNIPFLINDNVELAKQIDADGVHLGQGDMSPTEARKILGDNKIIGLTAFNPAHFEALDENVDYTGTGPFYATLTKPDKMVLGAEAFQSLVNISPVPVVGIGGITPENAAAVIEAGAYGVAMMRAISESDDPKIAAQAFVHAIKKFRKVS